MITISSISVCMATFNGEDFISEQINSILNNLGPNDELIIVDDCSDDRTIDIINNLKDTRIKLFTNKKNYGEVFSFNKALSFATNKFIFLSDQDDVWLNGRAKLMTQALNSSNAYLLTSNFSWIDKKGCSLNIEYDGVLSKNSSKNINNIMDIFIGTTNYFGCAMVLKKEFLKIIYPIPSFVESHDVWIAIAANLLKKNIHIDNKTFLKRFHNNNATSTISNRNFLQKVWSRVIFLISIIVIFKRKFF